MIGTVEVDPDTDETPYTNYGEPETEDELYAEYSPPPNRHSVTAYQEMVEEPWVEDSLRELLETRIDTMLEG